MARSLEKNKSVVNDKWEVISYELDRFFLLNVILILDFTKL